MKDFGSLSYQFLFIPMNSLEHGGHLPSLVHNVCLDAMSIDKRLDEVDSKFEVFPKWFDSVDCAKHPVPKIKTNTAVSSVTLDPFGSIKLRIIGDRRSVDVIDQSPRFKQFLGACEFGYGEGTLQRIITARVEEDDDSWLTFKELSECNQVSIVILKDRCFYFVASSPEVQLPGKLVS